MDRRPIRALTLLLSVFVLATSGRSAEGNSQSPPQSIGSRLDNYMHGEFGAAVDALTAERTVRSLSGDFRNRASEWIDRGPATDRVIRTQTAAAMSVELMAAAFRQSIHDYIASREVMEWACERLRRLPVSAFERWFYLASIALAQGAGDDSLLSGIKTGLATSLPTDGSHAEHAGRRFPADGRFRLAYVTTHWETQQIATWPMTPSTLVSMTWGRFSIERNNETRALDETERMLSALFSDADVGPEARLRSGILKFLRNRHAQARADLIEAERGQDLAVRYLAHLMLGVIAERDDDIGEAQRRFRAAFGIIPAASASVALASRLYRDGDREAAAVILNDLQTRPQVLDPWQLYGQRDYRFYDALRDQMRRAVVVR